MQKVSYDLTIKKRVLNAIEEMTFTSIDKSMYIQIAEVSKSAEDYCRRLIVFHDILDECLPIIDLLEFSQKVFQK